MIPKDFTTELLSDAKVTDIIGQLQTLKKKGSGYVTNCPGCNEPEGLKITPSKNMYKCFNCDQVHGNNLTLIQYMINHHGRSFTDAVKFIADFYGRAIPTDPETEKKQAKKPKKANGTMLQSFRDEQIKASGITEKDQKALKIISESESHEINLFTAGTIDQYGRLVPGDDMLIHYLDLDGRPVTFTTREKSARPRDFYRIRYQNPELHTDKNGKPMKYASPYGSGTHLFIPPATREAYQSGRKIKRLYIHEGEKKALKASIHGMPAVGVTGIQSIGQNGRLPMEFQLLVKRCELQEIVFVFDADAFDLSTSITPNKPAESRPRSFYQAVKAFRDYFRTFANQNIYIQLYAAFLKPNAAHEKGFDDMLAGSFAGHEADLRSQLEAATNEKDGQAENLFCIPVSDISDLKLQELWNLQSVQKFAERYRVQLATMPEFTFARHRWKFDSEGVVVLAQPLQENEKFWQEQEKLDRRNNPYTTYAFDYSNLYVFLKNRGFGRVMMRAGTPIFAHLTGKVVKPVQPLEIKDFVISITEEIANKEVLNMLYRGGDQYLGPSSLSNLKYLDLDFDTPEPNHQTLYFKNEAWKISAGGIEVFPLRDIEKNVWSDKVKDFEPYLIPNFFMTEKDAAGRWAIKFSDESDNSMFLHFLLMASDFNWREWQNESSRLQRDEKKLTADMRSDIALHATAKICAIGYLLHKYRDKSVERAIIGMDAKMSEVGESEGRSGKSLLGAAVAQMIPTVTIPGKKKDITEDNFLFEEVTEKTDMVFIDDTRTNLDFEFFFPMITGLMNVNAKGRIKFTLREQDVPKFYITTNHAITGSTASFRDRQALLAFSDYFNDTWKPIDEFGANFFSTDWNATQWNLFYNTMAFCLVNYFRVKDKSWGVPNSGLVQPSTERLERRRQRQEIGENFLTWADEYFGISDDIHPQNSTCGKLGLAISRTELYNRFKDSNPQQSRFVTPHLFKKKLKVYAQFRNLIYNPGRLDQYGRPGLDDKRGGVEYFTIAYLGQTPEINEEANF